MLREGQREVGAPVTDAERIGRFLVTVAVVFVMARTVCLIVEELLWD